MIANLNVEALSWAKMNDLIPAIIQDNQTLKVLMLGYMNKDAIKLSQTEGKVVFYSRSKMRLWQKGEISGNELELVEIVSDCDQDALLVLVKPSGMCCHLNTTSCFNLSSQAKTDALFDLEKLIRQRQLLSNPNSYTTRLFQDGQYRIAQKVGEEAVEVALASVKGDRDELKNETADLLFHLLVLLRNSEINLVDILDVLRERMNQN